MFEELNEIFINMDNEKLPPPRLSILKQQKGSNEDLPEITPRPSISRRVSFAASNYVKPFAADSDQNTIWDSTYEEIVNHTDSTASSSQNSKPIDAFNTTTIMDGGSGKPGLVLNIWTDSDSETSQTEEIKIHQDLITKPSCSKTIVQTELIDKENKNPNKIMERNANRVSNKTQLSNCDMELTKTVAQPEPIEIFVDDYGEVTMDITRVINKTIIETPMEIPKGVVNKTVLDVVEMEETRIMENNLISEDVCDTSLNEIQMETTQVIENDINNENLKNDPQTNKTENANSFMEITRDDNTDTQSVPKSSTEKKEDIGVKMELLNNAEEAAFDQTINKNVNLEEQIIVEPENATEEMDMEVSMITDYADDVFVPEGNCNREQKIEDNIAIQKNPSKLDIHMEISDISLLSNEEYLAHAEPVAPDTSLERLQKIGANASEDLLNSLSIHYIDPVQENTNLVTLPEMPMPNKTHDLSDFSQTSNEKSLDSTKEMPDYSVMNFSRYALLKASTPASTPCPEEQTSEKTTKKPSLGDFSSFHMNLSAEDIQLVNADSDSFKMSECAIDGAMLETLPEIQYPSLEEFEEECYTYRLPPIPKELDLSHLTVKAIKDTSGLLKELENLRKEYLIKMQQVIEKKRDIIKRKWLQVCRDVGYKQFLDEFDENLEGLSSSGSLTGDNSESIEVDVVSVHNKIEEASKRPETCYTYEKNEANKYYFSALNRALEFVVSLNPESEIVQNIKVTKDHRDYSKVPVKYFLLNVLEEKLSSNHIKHFLGETFDIISLLDYWNIAVEENMDFYDDFKQLQCFDFAKYGLSIDKESRVHFDLVSISPCMHWAIDVKLCPKNYAIEKEDDIVIYNNTSKSSMTNLFISKYLSEFQRDKHFLKNFIMNVLRYFKETKKSSVSLKTESDFHILCEKYLNNCL